MQFIVEVSARHIHLTQHDVDMLFGQGHQLTPSRPLSQPDQFLCEEKLTVRIGERRLENVSILGPVRSASQIELSRTDCISLRAKQCLRESGDISGTGSATLIGPKGELQLREGLIIAKRHIHMTPQNASEYVVTDKQIVKVQIESEGRHLIFGDVIVRVSDKYNLAMHVDTDEANAAMIPREGCTGSIFIK